MQKNITESQEKIQTHKQINKFLFPWIDHNRGKAQSQVITMPANSGRHENKILGYLNQGKSNTVLRTFDKDFSSDETGINIEGKWEHYRGDIFRSLKKINPAPQPTAAWFDFCGGLTEDNKIGIVQSIDKFFTHGSLLFVTLAVNAIRSLGNNSTTREVYECASSSYGKMILTDQLLRQMVARTGKKINPITETYTYRRMATTFAVYSYIVESTTHII
jgi:hypothetical protein